MEKTQMGFLLLTFHLHIEIGVEAHSSEEEVTMV